MLVVEIEVASGFKLKAVPLERVKYGRIGSKHRRGIGSRSKSVGIGRRLCQRVPERIVIDVYKRWLTYVADDVAPPVGSADTEKKPADRVTLDSLNINLDESC